MARPSSPTNAKTELHPSVDAFLEMLTSERGAAKNTTQAYWRDLADASLYIRAKFKTEIAEATTDQAFGHSSVPARPG